MIKLIPLFILTFITFLFATEGSKNENRSLTLVKIDKEINVDVVIDDAWKFADSTTNFFQLEPYFNQPTSVKTVAKVLTTEEAIYCLIP